MEALTRPVVYRQCKINVFERISSQTNDQSVISVHFVLEQSRQIRDICETS